MKLADAQALFAGLIAGEPGAHAAALSCLVAAPNGRLQRGIDVYLETVRQKTVQRLRVAFARVARLVGDEAFTRLVHAHVRACPPASRTHHEIMVRWPDFLEQGAPEHRRDLGDLARLELARCDVAAEASAEPATVAALAALRAGARGRLRLSPAIRLLRLAYDLSPLWHSQDADGPPPAPVPRSNHVLVWREGLTVFHACVEPAEAAALDRALAGESLAHVCEAFTGREDAAEAAHSALHGWFARGLVEAVEP